MLPKQIERQIKEADKMVEYIKENLPQVKGEGMKASLNQQFLELAAQLRGLLDEESLYEQKN